MCQKSKSGTRAANRDSNCISIKQVRENVVLVDKRSENILAEQKYRRTVDCTHIKLEMRSKNEKSSIPFIVFRNDLLAFCLIGVR